jgi:allantoinase
MDHHPRDYRGYGARPPDPRWPNGARIAVQIVMNYEEGSSTRSATATPARKRI